MWQPDWRGNTKRSLGQGGVNRAFFWGNYKDPKTCFCMTRLTYPSNWPLPLFSPPPVNSCCSSPTSLSSCSNNSRLKCTLRSVTAKSLSMQLGWTPSFLFESCWCAAKEGCLWWHHCLLKCDRWARFVMGFTDPKFPKMPVSFRTRLLLMWEKRLRFGGDLKVLWNTWRKMHKFLKMLSRNNIHSGPYLTSSKYHRLSTEIRWEH